MKVFAINSVCGIKSTGRICSDICSALSARGDECLMAYGRDFVPEKYASKSIRVGSPCGVYLRAMTARLFDNVGFTGKKATEKLISQIKEFDPDVIHLHNLHGYYIDVETLFDYLKVCGKKIVWTFHDAWAITGHCAVFEAEDCKRWISGCHDCPLKKEYPASMLIDNSKRNYLRKKRCFSGVKNLTIVTPSKWMEDVVKRSFLSDYPVTVIPNGIDVSAFKKTESDFKEAQGLTDKKIVLSVASVWTDKKGFSDFPLLRRLLPKEYEIVLIGVTDKQKAALCDGITGLKRTDSVESLAKIYSCADVFVNLTYEDNYPTVNLEAQSCGCPVITYRTGGSVESVPTSNVADKGDVIAVAELVQKGDLPLLYDLNCDKETMLKKYLEIYGERQ